MSAQTVGSLLQAARAGGVDRLDAQLLLAHVLQRPRAWLIAHEDAVLDAAQLVQVRAALDRRAAGVPVAYLLGEKEFHGLMLGVSPDVLVPRPDTEVLVGWALELLDAAPAGAEVADLGTGSGAIALALKHACPPAKVCAVDVSAAALAVARGNGERLALAVEWLAGHWWSALHARRFDLVVSNPPYIAEGDPHLGALQHEPQQALTSGADGLDAIREIVAGAANHLRPGAWLLLEHGHDQAPPVSALLRDAGFEAVATRPDLAGLPRCTGGRRPA
jgi:release factor glutamine methyltransferase